MTPKMLAAAIRRGGAMITPAVSFYEPEEKEGCVLCALATGIAGSAAAMWEKRINHFGDYVQFVADLSGISVETAREIENKYLGKSSHGYEPIAAWLDSLEPAHRQTFENFMAATLQAVELEPALSHLPKE